MALDILGDELDLDVFEHHRQLPLEELTQPKSLHVFSFTDGPSLERLDVRTTDNNEYFPLQICSDTGPCPQPDDSTCTAFEKDLLCRFDERTVRLPEGLLTGAELSAIIDAAAAG